MTADRHLVALVAPKSASFVQCSEAIMKFTIGAGRNHPSQ